MVAYEPRWSLHVVQIDIQQLPYLPLEAAYRRYSVGRMTGSGVMSGSITGCT
jgi:hypothetical protein